jgi:hypothetical protein
MILHKITEFKTEWFSFAFCLVRRMRVKVGPDLAGGKATKEVTEMQEVTRCQPPKLSVGSAQCLFLEITLISCNQFISAVL